MVNMLAFFSIGIALFIPESSVDAILIFTVCIASTERFIHQKCTCRSHDLSSIELNPCPAE